jgi:hypothetical protein
MHKTKMHKTKMRKTKMRKHKKYSTKKIYGGHGWTSGMNNIDINNPEYYIPLNNYHTDVQLQMVPSNGIRGGKSKKRFHKKNIHSLKHKKQGERKRGERKRGERKRGGSSFFSDMQNIVGNATSSIHNYASLSSGSVPAYPSNPTFQPFNTSMPHQPIANYNYA